MSMMSDFQLGSINQSMQSIEESKEIMQIDTCIRRWF